MKQKVFADIANKWNVMVENARPLLESIGPAAQRHENLSLRTQELIRLNEQAEAHRSELSRVVQMRKELVSEGGKTFRRFSLDLQAHHGLDSAELIRYGLRPKGRRTKKETTAKPKIEAVQAPAAITPD